MPGAQRGSEATDDIDVYEIEMSRAHSGGAMHDVFSLVLAALVILFFCGAVMFLIYLWVGNPFR